MAIVTDDGMRAIHAKKPSEWLVVWLFTLGILGAVHQQIEPILSITLLECSMKCWCIGQASDVTQGKLMEKCGGVDRDMLCEACLDGCILIVKDVVAPVGAQNGEFILDKCNTLLKISKQSGTKAIHKCMDWTYGASGDMERSIVCV